MQNNVCSDIFWYGDMLLHVWANNENFQKINLQNTWEIVRQWYQLTHFAYSYRLHKCFVENYVNSKCHIFLILYQIYIKFSLFYSKSFTISIELT